jgi:L-aspartate oxidase
VPSVQIPPSRRYLVNFDLKRVPHFFTDVLIIGGGISGLRAAMAIQSPLNAVVVTKDVIAQSNSAYAQGGIAGVLDPLDKFEKHASDTISAGKGLCDSSVVDMVVRDAPERIHELIRIGAEFDTDDGQIALTQEGGHSHRRIAHALGDATGKEIMRAIIETSRRAENVQIWEKTFTIDLLTHEGRCRGALVWNPHHGKTFVWAKETVIATGGAGALYRETTNPAIATADGHAICFRAGCELRDMEFMQFHPTVLYIAGSSRHLITEAVRGEGGHLVDASGYRFMQDYDDALELAPRDVVSQSITRQMEKTNHPCVYLDLSHIDPNRVDERFPHIKSVCAEFGIDIRSERIPVRPGAHYMIGGVTVDDQGRTSLPNLWGAGEVTSSGLHGANRLGSNSLLEGLVYGRHCGEGVAKAALQAPDSFSAPPIRANAVETHADDEDLNVTDLRNSLSSLMWRLVGIARDETGLSAALEQVEFWSRYVLSRELNGPAGWELQNMLTVARVMIVSAMARTESRGVHFRSDYPEMDQNHTQHITAKITIR